MAIPAWAIGAGALLKTPEVASDWMGLFDRVNTMRDESNATTALEQLEKLRTTGDAEAYQPTGYLRPETRMKLDKLRAEKLDLLRSQEAAPFQATAARYNSDPEFRNDPEALQEFARRPEFWLGTPDSGTVVTGSKRGAMPASTTGANPRIAEVLQAFSSGNQNALDAFRASSGDRMAAAHIATNKDLAGSFKDASMGVENYEKLSQADRLTEARNRANQFIADYPLDQTVESWNGLVEGLRTIPDLPPGEINSTLQEMAARNTAPTGTIRQRVANGPNSTVSETRTDMLGRPVTGTHVTSTNNPSDRELGLTGGSGDSGMLDVSWVGPDGTPQASRISRDQLPALKAQLQAQGVQTIDTVDGKRASKRETLIKPDKKARGLAALAPGGKSAAAAPAAQTGGYVFRDGKLVKQ